MILERRRGAERVLVCEAGSGVRVTLPVGWTDRVPERAGRRLDVEGLIELAALVEALDYPRSAGEDLP